MTDRHAPTADETATATHAAIDQIEAELKNLRAHATAVGYGSASTSYCAARIAAIISGQAGMIETKLRELGGRQAAVNAVDLP